MTIREIFKKIKCGHKEYDTSLKKYTTYKTDTIARLIVSPRNVDDLKLIIKTIKKNNLNYMILGNGSNLIFTNDIYEGVLIKLNKFDQMQIVGTRVIVGAGYNLVKLSMQVANESLTGLEFASGIPGTVGGAVYMNAGAYKSDMGYIVESVKVLTPDLEIKTMMNRELNYHYRSSFFQKNKDYIILEATISLKRGTKEAILAVIKDRRDRRIASQPLEYPNAGSVFRNPENDFAGRLIEEAGLKGASVNDAYVSEKHANFIINKGNAKGKDIKALIEKIKKEIQEKYNVDLKVEQEIIEEEKIKVNLKETKL